MILSRIPYGIPDPADFIGSDINVARPDWPASWLTGPTTATPGYYFIAPDDPSATNTANPYGHPDLPRANIPHTTEFEAGDFVWISGGTYVYATGSGLPNPGNWDVYCVATEAEPLWIVGDPDNRPVFETLVDIGGYGQGKYIFIDGLDLHGAGFEVRPKLDFVTSEIMIRNCVGVGLGITSGDYNGVVIGGSAVGVGVRDYDVENVVVYNCTLSNYGQWDFGSENDFCGVQKAERSNRLWVLGCEISHCGGDGCAGSPGSVLGDYPSDNYYIGGNLMYEFGENCIDLKGVDGIVVSENTMYGPMGSQQGGGAIFHRGGGSNPIVQNVSFIFNTLYNLSGGISLAGAPSPVPAGTAGILIGGNTFFHMSSALAVQPDNNLGFCIASQSSVGTVYVFDNSMEDYEIGVLINGPGSFDLNMIGNIFGTKTTYSGGESNENKQWIVEGSMPVVSDYNIYKGTPNFIYDGGTRNFAYLQGDGLEANSQTNTDPDYTNAGAGVLTLLDGSPAINASVEAVDAYDAFELIFGIDIRGFDKAGNARPASGPWDAGAYQGATAPPASPTKPGDPSTSAMAGMC